jgi:hypothetical protein
MKYGINKCVSDSEFCDALNLSDHSERGICIIIRNLVAQRLKCESIELSPDIKTRQIFDKSWFAFMAETIPAELEMSLLKEYNIEIHINDDEVKPFIKTKVTQEGAETFGEWVFSFVKFASQLISEGKERISD